MVVGIGANAGGAVGNGIGGMWQSWAKAPGSKVYALAQE